jgi:hypothetical protein
MDGIIWTIWISGAKMSSDLLKTNLLWPLFEKDVHIYCGEDQYMKGNKATLKGGVSQSG